MSRYTFYAAALMGTALTRLNGQVVSQPIRTDLSCVENMSVPMYDGGAWIARFKGEARVLLNVGANGTPVSIDVRSFSKPLTTWLKQSLQDAKFSRQCAGKRIEIKFIYELRGEPTPTPHNRLRLKSLNTFEVVANPPIPIPPQP